MIANVLEALAVWIQGVISAMGYTGVGGLMAVQHKLEVGTVVAIVSGLGKLNDPWGDLVNWGRELSVDSVKYRLFADALGRHRGSCNGLNPHNI